MAVFIKGPLSARPEVAKENDKFWDMNTDVTYTYKNNKWTSENEPVKVEAPVAAPVVEDTAPVVEKAPTVKKKSAKKSTVHTSDDELGQ